MHKLKKTTLLSGKQHIFQMKNVEYKTRFWKKQISGNLKYADFK